MITMLFFIGTFLCGQLLTLIIPNSRISLLDIYATCVFISWLVTNIRKPSAIRHGIASRDIWLFAFVSFVLIAIRAAAGNRTVIPDILYVARWVVYADLYFMIIQSGRSKQWLYALYVSGVMLATIGLIQLWMYPYLRNLYYIGWDPHLNRVVGSLLDPNFAGIIYALGFLLGLSLFRNGRQTVLLVLGEGMLFVALLLTYSRSSYLAFSAGILIWFFSRRLYAWSAVILAGFVCLLFLLPRGSEGQNLLRSASAFARVGSTEVGIQRFISSPIWGTGFVSKNELSATGPDVPPSRAGTVDMSLLYVFAASGIIGGIAYLFLWADMFSVARFDLLKRANPLLFSSFGALLIHSVFVNSLFYPWAMAWMWILVGASETILTADR